jgi:hypothetical protein
MTAIRFRVFSFIIKRFGRFRDKRSLTQAFDVGLAGLTLVTAPSVYSAIGDIRPEIRTWPDVTESAHKLGGHQFNWRGNELGHIHSNGVAGVRLNAPEKAVVLSKHLAQPHLMVLFGATVGHPFYRVLRPKAGGRCPIQDSVSTLHSTVIWKK